MNKIRIVIISLICVVGAALFALPAIEAYGGSSAPKNVTFNKDVAPIFYRSCAECHRPGEAAPFSVLGYKEVRPWRSRSRKRSSIAKCRPGMRTRISANG